MKKFSVLITTVISLAGMVINYITAYFWGHPILALNMGGGESSVYSGFGVVYTKFYPLLNVQQSNAHTGSNYEFGFNPLMFLVSWVLVFIVVLLMQRGIRLVKKTGMPRKTDS